MFIQKILCIGNESESSDNLTTLLAQSFNTTNHGLISTPNFTPATPGYYHTSVVDLTPGEIVKISDKFDRILMLDQTRESYTHFKTLFTTVRLMHDLEVLGIDVDYRTVKSAKNIIHWREYLQKNKSFCFHPFLAIINDLDSTILCPKAKQLGKGEKVITLTKLEDIGDWQTEPAYLDIRNKMAAGELLPKHCQSCYVCESKGEESTRQYETLEWAEKMSLTSVDDFFAVKNPVFYEIRPSNKCNVMCRTCDDGHSHLIQREWKKYKTIPLVSDQWTLSGTSIQDINFESAERIYFGGGEPTIMPEFYEFLRKATEAGHTDFELEIGTNGMKFSNTLLDLLDPFTDVNLAFSFDGYDRVNDYIRWGTDFGTVVRNAHILQERGHKISLQTVFSTYSITRLHEVFEFYDREFPKSGALVQVANWEDDMFSPLNNPCSELVIKSMRRCQETNIYYMSGRSIKSLVDLVIDQYSSPNHKINVERLRKFYDFNDKLDSFRNSQLGDYIPELEQARSLYL